MMLPELDERGRRRWAAVEARAMGWGGVSAVALATGLSDRTIRSGVAELVVPEDLEPGRQRRPGGGRLSYEDKLPELSEALDGLLDPTVRGDPMSPLRWTCKSTRSLADELRMQGFSVSSTTVGGLLKSKGYSIQSEKY